MMIQVRLPLACLYSVASTYCLPAGATMVAGNWTKTTEHVLTIAPASASPVREAENHLPERDYPRGGLTLHHLHSVLIMPRGCNRFSPPCQNERAVRKGGFAPTVVPLLADFPGRAAGQSRHSPWHKLCCISLNMDRHTSGRTQLRTEVGADWLIARSFVTVDDRGRMWDVFSFSRTTHQHVMP